MRTTCPVCGSATIPSARVHGRYRSRDFRLRRCRHCRFVYVADPWTDYERIYDEVYYAGRGADPLVHYLDEVANATTTVRRYEWRGIHARVASLTTVDADTVWLDYGCGPGGLVRYLRTHGVPRAVGMEQGWCVETLRADGVPVVTTEELGPLEGRCDVVTAVEVIEHAVDPVAELQRMRSLLRPGGLLFLTTGNLRPYRERLTRWRYVVPEVHVSFFEPETLALALSQAGFAPAFPGYGPGWADIIRFKVLKNLRRTRTTPAEQLVPWETVARVVDQRLQLSAHPVGWAPVDKAPSEHAVVAAGERE